MKIDTYGWAPIVKSEKQDDGTLLVTGRVSDDGLDRDAQRCDAAWLDQAVPQWFAEGGNVREMHGHIAAGVAIEHWKADDSSHWVSAHVVDSGSIAKVEAGVLRGFSIGIKGGRVTKSQDAPNGRIVAGQIIEVSLVDRPANPTCMLAIAKADGDGHAVAVEQTLVEEPTMRVAPAAADAVATAKADEPQPPEPVTVPVTADTEVVVSTAADDVRAAAQGVLDALASLSLPPWVKEDQASDIATAEQAIAIIARLIQSEAQGLMDGDLSEAYDVDNLLCAVNALRWFIESEQAEQIAAAADLSEVTDVMTVMLADEPDTAKADTTPSIEGQADGPTLVKADLDALTASLTAKFEGIVAEALTKAEEAHKAETSALRAELAQVKAQPVAGGPVRVRTTQDRVKADQADAASLLAQAGEYETKADAATDRALADGYRAIARDLRTKAAR